MERGTYQRNHQAPGWATVETGQGRITLLALAGIWSVSALTSLPGLAVSPILDKLSVVFPAATELDLQLLATLPSLLIIPFILFAGYITERIGYIRLLYIGLWLFLLSGALYFLCGTITQLVIVSALLGIGAGIIIPLSTSLISMFFTGERRTKQFGYVSAITNISLVVASAVAGWLADIQWRLPFLVYLLPLFSILLVPAIKRGGSAVGHRHTGQTVRSGGRVDYRNLSKYMLYYLLATYLVTIVSIDLPFLLGSYGYDSGVSGSVISLFFIAIMLPGLFINRLIKMMGANILVWAMLLMALGLLDVFYNSSMLFVVIGCVAAGFGYGMAQPYIYDVTASLASPGKVTYALALVMAMNYVAIVICPFVVDWMQDALAVKGERFPFAFNAVLGFVALLFMLLRQLFRNNKQVKL